MYLLRAAQDELCWYHNIAVDVDPDDLIDLAEQIGMNMEKPTFFTKDAKFACRQLQDENCAVIVRTPEVDLEIRKVPMCHQLESTAAELAELILLQEFDEKIEDAKVEQAVEPGNVWS